MARPNQDGARRRVLRPDNSRPALKRRLLLPIAAILILTWLGAAVFTKKAAFRESRAFLIGEANAIVQTLLSLAPSAASPEHLDGEGDRVLMLWQGKTLIFSQNAMERPVPTQRANWIEDLGPDNWVFSTACSDNECALVGIRDTERKMAIRRLVAAIYIPLLAVLGLGLWAASIAISRAIRPVTDVSTRVAQMDLDELKLLPLTKLDQELLPLVTAINHLMERMRKQLDQERAFLGIYAHEIRTPVAGLDAQIQLFKAEYPSDSPTVQNILDCAERTVRVANQFLALARSKNAAALANGSSTVNFAEQVRQSLIETMALEKDIDIEMVGTCNAQIAADPFALDTIVRNLVGNAILYAQPANGRLKIAVECSADCDRFSLVVEDNGQGLTPDQMTTAVQEFTRIPGKNKPNGTGLGLSIVSHIAGALGGTLKLTPSPRLGGLRCHVSLPLDIKRP